MRTVKTPTVYLVTEERLVEVPLVVCGMKVPDGFVRVCKADDVAQMIADFRNVVQEG